MSQITIRDIPSPLEDQLRRLAKDNKTSLNKTITSLLFKALGLSGDLRKKRDLSDLSGSWSKEEWEDFEKNSREFHKIDDEIWD